MNDQDDVGSPTEVVSSELYHKYRSIHGTPSMSDSRVRDLSDIDIETLATFAILEPLNPAARRSFHEVAKRSRELTYHSKFIRIYGDRDSEGDEVINSDISGQHEGCYVFSLAELPEFPALGWRIGKGRAKEVNQAVDLLLMDPDLIDDEIAGLHAIFTWVPSGGGFFLQASNTRGKPVYMNGKRLIRDQRLIPHENQIGIGNHTYTLIYSERSPIQEIQFQTELRSFFATIHGVRPPVIQPTPSRQTHKIADYTLGNPIGRGTFGIVFAGTHERRGIAVAVKQILRTRGNTHLVEREVEIQQLLTDNPHENVASPLDILRRDCQSEASTARLVEMLDATYRPSSSDILEMVYFVLPLQSATFNSLNTSSVSTSTRVTFFKQVLAGVAWIHSLGVAHRDLKPANVVVGQYDPPYATIIDFGCATTARRVLYDRPGTVPYLAPEQKDGFTHDSTVDEWAVALMGTELFGRPRPRRQLTESDYYDVQHWLRRRKAPEMPIADVCSQMLQWIPSDRLAAAEALSDPSIARYAYTQADLGKLTSKMLSNRKRGVSDSI